MTDNIEIEHKSKSNVNWSELVYSLTVAQIQDLTTDVIALEKAMKNIPEAFNESFQEKINTIIEITTELENHSLHWERNITKKIKIDLAEHESNIKKMLISKEKEKDNSKLYWLISLGFVFTNIFYASGIYYLLHI